MKYINATEQEQTVSCARYNENKNCSISSPNIIGDGLIWMEGESSQTMSSEVWDPNATKLISFNSIWFSNILEPFQITFFTWIGELTNPDGCTRIGNESVVCDCIRISGEGECEVNLPELIGEEFYISGWSDENGVEWVDSASRYINASEDLFLFGNIKGASGFYMEGTSPHNPTGTANCGNKFICSESYVFSNYSGLYYEIGNKGPCDREMYPYRSAGETLWITYNTSVSTCGSNTLYILEYWERPRAPICVCNSGYSTSIANCTVCSMICSSMSSSQKSCGIG